MSDFEFKFHPEFFDDLNRLDKNELEAVNKHIERIKENPTRFKRLHGRENCFSVRSGDTRIIYHVGVRVVWFLLVGRRDDVYQNYMKRLYKVSAELQ